MRDRDDFDLLHEYASAGSQEAFAEVVRRHVDLVYSSAVRHVRDRHAAADVTQVVFIILARRVARVGRGSPLSSWLLGVTRFAAKDWLRSDARRRRREQVFAREKAEQMACGTSPKLDPDPSDKPPTPGFDADVDDALAKLSVAARDALVLRFFEGKSFREVGDRLGISEDAAKQRVFRALERLRALLTGRKSPTLTAEVLAVTLAATAVLPAPAGLGATAAAAATSAAAAAQFALMLKGVTSLMAWTKAKVAAAWVAGIALLAGTGATVVQYAASRADDDVVVPVQTAAASETLAGNDGPAAEWGSVVGFARTTDGKPIAGAVVQLVPMRRTVLIYGRTDNVQTTTTDPHGKFEITPAAEPAAVIVRNPQFVGTAVVKPPPAGIAASPLELTVRPWGRLEGTVIVQGKPVPNADLFLWQPVVGEETDRSRWIDRNAYLRSDAQGRFVLDRVLPGDTRVDVRGEGMVLRSFRYDVPPGQTTTAIVGETGRTLVGRVTPALPNARHRRGQLHPTAAPSGPIWPDPRGSGSYVHAFPINPDGTFSTNDVPTGKYTVSVLIGEADPDGRLLAETARGATTIDIPAPDTGAPDMPFDVGEVQLRLAEGVVIGQEVPALEGSDANGKPISLRDFRGKHVLLHLSPGHFRDDPRILKVLHDRFVDEGLVMVTAYLAPPGPNAVIDARNEVTGPQIVPGPTAAIHEGLSNSRARLLLLDDRGRLLARASVAPVALDTVAGALKERDAGVHAARSVSVVTEHVPAGQVKPQTPFSRVSPPRPDDAARNAVFTVVDGTLRSGERIGGLPRLNDGLLQPHEDSPPQSAFFEHDTLEGRLRIDLGKRITIGAINTYSWHKDDRGPQVYNVFGSNGWGKEFDPAPKIGSDPTQFGWTKIATVDTRPDSATSGPAFGGRYGVSITAGAAPQGLGDYRYLLFEMFVTQTKTEWGHTFYGEIDVVAK